MAVPGEPPPIRVRSDLQASLAGWSFCPFKATFGSAHWTSLGVWAYPALWRGEGGVSDSARFLQLCQQRSRNEGNRVRRKTRWVD